MNAELNAWNTQEGASAFATIKHSLNFALPIEEQIELPRVLEMLGDSNDKTVLELGCGDGHVLEGYFPQAQALFGLDRSLPMIKTSTSVQQANYLVADLESSLPFSNQKIDVAYSRFVLMFISDLNNVANETARVLKANGKFAFTVTNPIYPYLQKMTQTSHRYKGLEQYGEKRQGSMTFNGQEYPFHFRPSADYIQPFIQAGFGLTHYFETVIPNQMINSNPSYERMRDKPVYLTLGFSKKD